MLIFEVGKSYWLTIKNEYSVKGVKEVKGESETFIEYPINRLPFKGELYNYSFLIISKTTLKSFTFFTNREHNMVLFQFFR